MKEENKKQEEAKSNESATSSETANKLLEERVAELKAKLFMEVPESAGFTTEQTLVVRGIILDAVNQAVEIGQLYPAFTEEKIKDATDNLTKMWERITNPSANVKAESLSKLYHLQRYVINNLVNTIQTQHTIAGVIEAEGTPFQSPMDVMGTIFAPSAFSSIPPILEKAVKED